MAEGMQVDGGVRARDKIGAAAENGEDGHNKAETKEAAAVERVGGR